MNEINNTQARSFNLPYSIKNCINNNLLGKYASTYVTKTGFNLPYSPVQEDKVCLC